MVYKQVITLSIELARMAFMTAADIKQLILVIM